jgi:hypothetical protein
MRVDTAASARKAILPAKLPHATVAVTGTVGRLQIEEVSRVETNLKLQMRALRRHSSPPVRAGGACWLGGLLYLDHLVSCVCLCLFVKI